jgi:alkylation response protein AidB-like acyl-CoA dehydrogenase
VRPPVLLSKIITLPTPAPEPRAPIPPDLASLPPDLASFRTELRRWLSTSFPKEDGPPRTGSDRDPERHRHLQRLLFEGGFAGLTYPVAYGGRGLSPEFQDAFNEEAAGYELPTLFNVTIGILGPTILDFGSEEQKRRHLPAILRGDELWVQLLSEPASGSDLAGCITRATRDGDQWILNGSKIWSTGAHFSDFALCLARSNWSQPKHRGLTMYILALVQAGIDIEPIRQANGDAEFCQEFITDVAIDATATLGEENAGWQVASRLLYHERNLAGAASQYTYGFEAEGTPVAPTPDELKELALTRGSANDSRVRALVAEAYALESIQAHLVERINDGINGGALEPTFGSLLRLFEISKVVQNSNSSVEIAGAEPAVGPTTAAGSLGGQFLMRQAAALAGGSIEMQRNIIAERVLGLPRELALDVGVPFDSVPHNVTSSRR